MKTKITLLLSGIFLSAISFSQTPDWLWAKGMFGSGGKTGQGIAVDASDNVYTTGMFAGTVDFDPGPGTFNITSAGVGDIFISKFDGSGNFVWAISFSGGYDDRSNAIALDASGNIFTTGTFRGTVDFDPGPGTFNLTATGLTSGDIYVSKLDNAGNFIWAKSMVGATSIEDVGLSVAADASGNIYTTGYFLGTVDFDPSVAGTFNLTSAGSADVFISKLDALGNFTWAKQLGGTSYDKALSVKVDASGNVYTTGTFIGSADMDPGAATYIFNATSSIDAFISKLDASGNFVWAKQISGSSDQVANSLVIAGSGDVCITGAFYGLTDFDPGAGTYNLTPTGSGDIFISRLDASGNFIWAKKTGGTTGDIGCSIDADASGNLFTTGTFTGTSDFDPGAGVYNLTSAGAYDVFVCKSDGFGNFIWAKKIGGTDYEYVNSIAVSAFGNLNITGSFHSPTIGLGTTTLIYGGTIYDDIFIAKLDNPVSPPLALITADGPTSICAPGTVTLNANTGTGLTYQWRQDNVNIAGANSSSYVTGSTGNFECLVSNASGSSISNVIAVYSSTTPPAAAITAGGPTTFCTGGNVTLSANSGGEFSYQWRLNGVNISGATASTRTVTAAGSYDCIVTNGCGSSVSNIILVTVNSGPPITISAAGPVIFCAPGSVVLNANPSSGITYQWRLNSVNISGATTSSYVATATGIYTCVGNNGCNATSNSISVYALTGPPSAVISAGGPTTFCGPGTVTLSALTGTGQTYQWRLNGINISGATNSTRTISSSGSYDCIVTNACASSTSNTIVVTVNPLPAASITAGGPTTFCSPGTVLLSANTGNGLTYQWRLNSFNILNAVNTTYLANAGGNYDCIVTNTCGSTTSNSITVTVATAPPIAAITTAGSTTFCQPGSVVLFANTAQGQSYQWRLNNSNIAGATVATYIASATGNYDCIVSNACGSATSNTISVTVNPLPFALVTPMNSTICYTSFVTLSTTFSSGYTYQWLWNNNIISGATSYFYTTSAAGTYTCVVTNACGSVTSNQATVVVYFLPTASITASGPTAICPTCSVMLNANTGTGLSYQWRLNSVNINGATSPSYVASAAGAYTCEVTNLCGSSISNVISVQILQPISANALRIDGVNGYGNVQNYYNSIDTGNFTIEAWIQDEAPIVAGGSEPILDNMDNSQGPDLGFRVEITDGHLAFFAGLYGNSCVGADLRDNVCHHIAITRNSSNPGDNIRFYIDGQFAGSAYNPSSLNSSAPSLYIGAKENLFGPGVWAFNGLIKEIRIWNVERTQSQLQAHMGYTLIGNANQNLVGYWKCSEGSGWTAYDYSINGNNGALSSGTSWDLGCSGCALPPAAITASGSTSLCPPATVTLNANTGAGISYQWRLNGVPISNATLTSYVASAAGNYDCVETNTCGSIASNVIAVTINTPPPASIAAAGPVIFCDPGSVVLNANTGSGLTYQWRQNSVNISGETFSSFTAIATGSYDCVVTNSCGSTTSNSLSVTAELLPSAAATAGGPTTFCTPGSVVLSVSTCTNCTYQWRVNAGNISGANSSTYTATSAGSYDCVVTNTCGSRTSNNIVVTTISGSPTASITANGSTTFCSPGSVTLNANTGSGLTYQWRLNGGNISGATSYSYVVTASGNFDCVVSNACGSVTSNLISVTVTAFPTASITAGGPTTFCSPGSVTLNANTGSGLNYQWRLNGGNISGATASSYVATAAGSYNCIVSNTCGSATSNSITVTVGIYPPASVTAAGSTTFCSPGSVLLNANTGAGLTYQWRVNGGNISGATSTFYYATATGLFDCVVSSSCGSAISNSISVLVSTYPQAIITASGPTSFCTPGSVTLNANTGTGLSYQWKQNGADIPGATVASLIVSSTGSYECLVTNYCGSTISNSISVSTGPLPSTPGNIAGQTTGVCALTLSYSVAPVSGATGYSWTVPSGANLNSGQGTISINVTFTNTFSGGNISVEATSACGNSGASTIAVSGVPAQPGTISGPASVCVHQNNVIYNITPVSGATSYTWTVPPGTQIKTGQGTIQIKVRFGTSAGSITVAANNACGSGPIRSLAIAMPCREGENISSDDFTVNVFPNPSNNDFTFIIAASQNNLCSINIFDLAGRVVESHQNIPANKEFKCGEKLVDGIYFAETISGVNKKVLKLVMQR